MSPLNWNKKKKKLQNNIMQKIPNPFFFFFFIETEISGKSGKAVTKSGNGLFTAFLRKNSCFDEAIYFAKQITQNSSRHGPWERGFLNVHLEQPFLFGCNIDNSQIV